MGNFPTDRSDGKSAHVMIKFEDSGAVRASSQKALKRDLLVAIGMFLVATSAFISFDFFEWFFEFSRSHENFELDELAGAIPALAIATAWFAIGRWRQAAKTTNQLESSIQNLQATTEKLAVAHEREELASRVKSTFLSMMSDEIRTPMNGVIAPAEALLESDLDDQQRTQVTRVLQSSRSLLQSIDDILELAALESGPIDVETDQIEIVALLDELALHALGRKSEHVELSFYVDPILPSVLIGNRRRLLQILAHLLDNAWKFTDTGGVSIAVSGEPQSDGNLLARFEVRDTGIGIAPEHLPTLFDNFTKITSPAAHYRPGAGIGLAISQKLARYLGGEIGVESPPGSGSTFWFTMPCASGEETANVHARDALSGVCVLIVDDVELSRETLSKQISAWGATVQTASFDVEAIATLRKAVEVRQNFNIVLVNNHTETMNGLALAALISDDLRLEDLKITLNGQANKSAQTLRDEYPNILSVLTKPMRPTDLRDSLLEISAATSQPR